MERKIQQRQTIPEDELTELTLEEVDDVTEHLEDAEPSIKSDRALDKADMEAAGILPSKKGVKEDQARKDVQKSINLLTKRIEEDELSSDELVDITDRFKKLEYAAEKARQDARLEKIKEHGSAIRQYVEELYQDRIILPDEKPLTRKIGDEAEIAGKKVTVEKRIGKGAFGEVFDVTGPDNEIMALKLDKGIEVSEENPNTEDVDRISREGLIGRIMSRGEIINRGEQNLIISEVMTALKDRYPDIQPYKIQDDLEKITNKLVNAEDTEEFSDIIDKHRDKYPPYLVKEFFRARIGKTRKIHLIADTYAEQMVETKQPEPGSQVKRLQLELLMRNLKAENEGRPKKERIVDLLKANPRLSEEQKSHVAMGAIFALSKLHERGIAHRDIKPANIMVDPTLPGAVKLFDFGLSASEHEGSTYRDGKVVGSPKFMSPESIGGSVENLRAQDVYSLGVTLYQTFFKEEGFFKPENKDDWPKLVTHIFRNKTVFKTPEYLSQKADSTKEPFKKELLFLIEKMTDPIPDARPDIKKIAKAYHKVFRKYHGLPDVIGVGGKAARNQAEEVELEDDDEPVFSDADKTIVKKRTA